MPAVAPLFKLNAYVPLAAFNVSVTGDAFVTVVEDALTPVPVVTVHVPPVTESVVVGAGSALPARVIVTVVAVPLEYPVFTDALDGDGTDKIIE